MATLLLTAASSELGGELARALTVTALLPDTAGEFADEETERLLAGSATVVHLEPALAASNNPDSIGWLDACTRGTYDLMLAAQQHGVEHFVLVSSLDVLVNLEPDLHPAVIQASWRPRPSTAPSSLGPHCAEFVARQFAFLPGASMRVSVVRLGDWSHGTGRFWTSVPAISAALAAALDTTAGDSTTPMYNVVHCGEQQDGWVAPAAPSLRSPKPALRSAVLLGSNGMMGPPVASALARCRKRPFYASFTIATINLPRHARDKHKETSCKRRRFPAGTASSFY
jgi:nucleoside-diphosphate-sugar epimerase